MSRTNRRQPGFDSLESLLLLSTGVAAVSSSAQRDTLHGYRLELNGTLHGNKTVLILDAHVPPAADSQVLGGTVLVFRHKWPHHGSGEGQRIVWPEQRHECSSRTATQSEQTDARPVES